VNQWAGLSDPIALLDAMWNHRAEMLAGTASKGAPLPQLSAQDLTDMRVYLRNQPGTRDETVYSASQRQARGTPYFNPPVAPSAINRWMNWL